MCYAKGYELTRRCHWDILNKGLAKTSSALQRGSRGWRLRKQEVVSEIQDRDNEELKQAAAAEVENKK